MNDTSTLFVDGIAINTNDPPRRRMPLNETRLGKEDNLTLELFYELRRIRHALERMSPPSESDEAEMESEDSFLSSALRRSQRA